ncbi:hypothetical protein [Kitasatospora camelliae]|uniref:Uncharacterized protein n=1 Tax=Kitasatospora camelliae TaxID=3156397 RepID=A0AAU8JV26_9ACTN
MWKKFAVVFLLAATAVVAVPPGAAFADGPTDGPKDAKEAAVCADVLTWVLGGMAPISVDAVCTVKKG